MGGKSGALLWQYAKRFRALRSPNADALGEHKLPEHPLLGDRVAWEPKIVILRALLAAILPKFFNSFSIALFTRLVKKPLLNFVGIFVVICLPFLRDSQDTFISYNSIRDVRIYSNAGFSFSVSTIGSNKFFFFTVTMYHPATFLKLSYLLQLYCFDQQLLVKFDCLKGNLAYNTTYTPGFG